MKEPGETERESWLILILLATDDRYRQLSWSPVAAAVDVVVVVVVATDLQRLAPCR